MWTVRLSNYCILWMGSMRIRLSSHEFATQSSHSVNRAGWQANMSSLENWIRWRNVQRPDWKQGCHINNNRSKFSKCFAWCTPSPSPGPLHHAFCRITDSQPSLDCQCLRCQNSCAKKLPSEKSDGERAVSKKLPGSKQLCAQSKTYLCKFFHLHGNQTSSDNGSCQLYQNNCLYCYSCEDYPHTRQHLKKKTYMGWEKTI